jgi:hypothetical protein
VPTPVKVYRWRDATDPMPLNETDWVMFELPSAGDRYWHDTDGFTVRDVDTSQDPPVVQLVFDHVWMDAVNGQLPDGYVMDGGRNSDTGEWHFGAITPQHDRPLGPTFGGDLEETIARAIANAAEYNRRQSDG